MASGADSQATTSGGAEMAVPEGRRSASPLPIELLRLLRPKQWSKNLLVFAAVLFTGGLTDWARLGPTLLAFAALCLASSAVYVLNDLIDVEKDRRHPKKRFRPLASGALPTGVAWPLSPLLAVAAIVVAWQASRSAAIGVGIYLVLQSLYNFGLKKAPIADVFAISLGFVLRAIVGAAAIHVSISGWLLFCTGALALMLGFGKRRQEFVSQGLGRGETRASLEHYSLKALDALVMMTACAAALCYGIYSIESRTARQYPALVITALPVFYGVSRYVLRAFTDDEGGEPENLLFSDPHILLSVLVFVATAAFALSGVRIPFLEGAR